jgi:hypothetical protein
MDLVGGGPRTPSLLIALVVNSGSVGTGQTLAGVPSPANDAHS